MSELQKLLDLNAQQLHALLNEPTLEIAEDNGRVSFGVTMLFSDQKLAEHIPYVRDNMRYYLEHGLGINSAEVRCDSVGEITPIMHDVKTVITMNKGDVEKMQPILSEPLLDRLVKQGIMAEPTTDVSSGRQGLGGSNAAKQAKSL